MSRQLPPRTLARLLARLAPVLLMGLLPPVGLAVPAAAHDALSGSTPADGSSVEVPPAAVDLVFGQPPLALGSEVRVTGPDGQVVNAGDLVLSGTTVTQPLADDLPAGTYAVAWRVTSADGHPISGELSFTATGGAEPQVPEEPTEQPTEQPTEEPTASVEPDPAETEDAEAGADPAAPAADDFRAASWVPWLLGGVVLAAAAAATAWWAARRRRAGGPPADGQR